jgi:phosphatidylglycerophosphatase GEP4
MPLLSNLPALRLTLAYVLHDSSSLLPHSTIQTLLYLPLPISSALPTIPSTGKKPNIRALVLDKDNTICPPESTFLHTSYVNKIKQLKASPEFAHNPHSIVIVSNTAGSTSAPQHEVEAKQLESELGLPVLRQQPGRKKPFCGPDLLEYFRKHGVTENPAEIAVVGDRLATDVLLAREMGSWSIWCRDGWRNPESYRQDYRGFFSRMEGTYQGYLRGSLKRVAPLPAKP